MGGFAPREIFVLNRRVSLITYTNEISIEEYTELRDAVEFRRLSVRQAEAALRASHFIVAAKDGTQTVGMTRLMSDGGYFAVVLDVIVLPEYQGRGIGRAMMAQAAAHLQDSLQPGEQSYVLLTSAPGKEGFYEKCGFHAVPNEGEGAGLVMRLYHSSA